jgi:integrase
MARAYRSVRPKANLVYAVEDVLGQYGICRNTLTNWIKAGLRPVDSNQPQLFRGAELIWFHNQRALNSTQKLGTGQFKCLNCKARVYPDPQKLTCDPTSSTYLWANANCPKCDGRLSKLVSAADCDKLRACAESNTSLQSIDEDEGLAPVGIGKVRSFDRPCWNPGNERILYEYQLYAKRFDPKTVDAMFASIRHFETFIQARSFSELKPTIVSAYRDALVEPQSGNEFKTLSRSTIAHRALHVRAFLKWLVKQDGFRKLNGSLCDYIILSKQHMAKTIQPPPKDIPSQEQLLKMLSLMPTAHRTERRDRAIVSASFLFGTRADNTASLRMTDVDCIARKVAVDATKVRVKNSKSQIICWFPVGDVFEQIICGWIDELLALGALPNDALFPPDAALAARTRLIRVQDRPVAPWETDQGVRRAFAYACKAAGVPYYTPHSARHFLVLLQDKYCKNGEQRKAWSFNLGHENEHVTLTNYAKMTPLRRDDVFSTISAQDVQADEDKDLLLAFYEHKLAPGSPEFERASALQFERLQREKLLHR